MIPKVIHYTWFSGDEMPSEVKNCMASWKRFLPDYQLRLWDMKSIEMIDSTFLKEAISSKKWAYAADFVRLYALYNEGGIYLDTDVILFKNFDQFLKDSCFIGKEEAIRFENFGGVLYLSSHCMGAEANHPFIQKCLSYYSDRHFIISNNEELPTLLRYNYVLLPYIQAVTALDFGYKWDPRIEGKQNCKDGLIIYPSDYFCGLPFVKESYCQHLALGSWREHFDGNKRSNNPFYKRKQQLARLLRSFLLKHSYALIKITCV